ncbi:citrate/2-methylcitrate synthase [Ochrobactrum sp. Marseille-Q0166]|uniref:citrate/2-methylcitrate synthase n=1 Tax=Ochrobactrum sp. Marseille-Q0166 TaxID=2761105 RepID=UPI0016560D2E|nr:citrate/2-methylcitrate synthase [Ochrobactrum sp. Marseille-Q0166]MBC8717459.1 citrate synthase/methylcitrate synthase [Ochrobactrum sp. Marseille-Q0166]
MKDNCNDVVFSETIISRYDDQTGDFFLLGKSIKRICHDVKIEGCIDLLWPNFFQKNMFDDNLQFALGQAREQIFHYTEEIDDTLLEMSPLEAIRALVSRIPDGNDFTTALHVVAAPAVFAPAFIRMKRGRHIIRPDSSLPHSADILRMMNVSMPEPQEAQALDTFLISVVDFGLTPATLAARISASERQSITSSIITALSVLSEKNQKCNPTAASNILDILSSEKMTDDWPVAAIDGNAPTQERGSLSTSNGDVRADIIKSTLVNLQNDIGLRVSSKVSLIESLDDKFIDDQNNYNGNNGLFTRHKIYSALLLEQLGFPSEVFSCVVAMGRTVGWVAHCREQMQTPWLVRPTLRYTGVEE